jgi:outer membrane protein TolC
MVRSDFLCAAFLGALLISSVSWGENPPQKKGPIINLSQKAAAELVLKQGLRTKEVNYKYQALALSTFLARSKYDWKISLQSGKWRDRTESVTTYNLNPEFENYTSTAAISKSLLTGTTLTLGYTRNSYNYINPALNYPVVQDGASLTLEQSLLGNFFGNADRATVNAAEIEYDANLILRVNELEDLVLETLRQFWTTYVAQENFQEALNEKDRYEKLVASVKRKSSHGYSSPGELSQVQAEYETKVQTVKVTSIDYLRNLEVLVTLLGLEPGTDINFIVPTTLPPVPQLKNIAIEERRVIRSQKRKVEAAQESLKAAESNAWPTLNFVGIVGGTGLAETGQEAYSKITSQSNPKQYVGLKFEYNFGSDIQSQTEFNRRVNYELEQTRLKRQVSEEQDREIQAERKVAAAYAVAQSTKLEKEFREKAVKELTQAYNQGRTDIRNLIEAMNNYFKADLLYVRYIGDYQIALNEWAALRDELIPNKEEK